MKILCSCHNIIARQRCFVLSVLVTKGPFLSLSAFSNSSRTCCAVFSRCVFVDAGVAPIDIETRKIKEEMKMKEAQVRAVAEHGELALITVEGPQSVAQERVSLRPPMLQVETFLDWFSLNVVSNC